MCLQMNWSIGPVLHGQPWSPGAFYVGDSIPLVTLVCKNCFFVASFAAVPSGVITDPGAPEIKTKPAVPFSKTREEDK